MENLGSLLEGYTPILLFIFLCFTALLIMFFRVLKGMDELKKNVTADRVALLKQMQQLTEQLDIMNASGGVSSSAQPTNAMPVQSDQPDQPTDMLDVATPVIAPPTTPDDLPVVDDSLEDLYAQEEAHEQEEASEALSFDQAQEAQLEAQNDAPPEEHKTDEEEGDFFSGDIDYAETLHYESAKKAEQQGAAPATLAAAATTTAAAALLTDTAEVDALDDVDSFDLDLTTDEIVTDELPADGSEHGDEVAMDELGEPDSPTADLTIDMSMDDISLDDLAADDLSDTAPLDENQFLSPDQDAEAEDELEINLGDTSDEPSLNLSFEEPSATADEAGLSFVPDDSYAHDANASSDISIDDQDDSVYMLEDTIEGAAQTPPQDQGSDDEINFFSEDMDLAETMPLNQMAQDSDDNESMDFFLDDDEDAGLEITPGEALSASDLSMEMDQDDLADDVEVDMTDEETSDLDELVENLLDVPDDHLDDDDMDEPDMETELVIDEDGAETELDIIMDVQDAHGSPSSNEEPEIEIEDLDFSGDDISIEEPGMESDDDTFGNLTLSIEREPLDTTQLASIDDSTTGENNAAGTNDIEDTELPIVEDDDQDFSLDDLNVIIEDDEDSAPGTQEAVEPEGPMIDMGDGVSLSDPGALLEDLSGTQMPQTADQGQPSLEDDLSFDDLDLLIEDDNSPAPPPAPQGTKKDSSGDGNVMDMDLGQMDVGETIDFDDIDANGEENKNDSKKAKKDGGDDNIIDFIIDDD